MAAATRGRTATRLPCGVLLVVLFTFSAWSLRVAFLGYDGVSDLAIAGVANEALRAVIFVGPALLYLRYAERAQATRFLWLAAPSRKALWITADCRGDVRGLVSAAGRVEGEQGLGRGHVRDGPVHRTFPDHADR